MAQQKMYENPALRQKAFRQRRKTQSAIDKELADAARDLCATVRSCHRLNSLRSIDLQSGTNADVIKGLAAYYYSVAQDAAKRGKAETGSSNPEVKKALQSRIHRTKKPSRDVDQ